MRYLEVCGGKVWGASEMSVQYFGKQMWEVRTDTRILIYILILFIHWCGKKEGSVLVFFFQCLVFNFPQLLESLIIIT